MDAHDLLELARIRDEALFNGYPTVIRVRQVTNSGGTYDWAGDIYGETVTEISTYYEIPALVKARPQRSQWVDGAVRTVARDFIVTGIHPSYKQILDDAVEVQIFDPNMGSSNTAAILSLEVDDFDTEITIVCGRLEGRL